MCTPHTRLAFVRCVSNVSPLSLCVLVGAVGTIGRRVTSPPFMDSYQSKKVIGPRSTSSHVLGDYRPRTRTDASLLNATTASVPIGRSYPHEAESLDRVVMLERQIQVKD